MNFNPERHLKILAVLFYLALLSLNFCFAGVKYTAIPVTSSTISGKTFEHQYLLLDGKSYLTFKDCEFKNCGQVRGKNAHHITFLRCKFHGLSPDNIIFVQLGPRNDYWRFEFCEFWDTPNAIYSKLGDGPPASFLSVLNCYFHDIATGTYTVQRDGHCIGVQGGCGHQFAWNRIRNVGGTAIVAWASMTTPLTYVNFYENDIENVCKNPGASGSGIEISSSYDLTKNLPPPGWRIGHLVIRNKIRNVEGNGFRYACARDPLAIHTGNIYENCAAGDEYIHNPFNPP